MSSIIQGYNYDIFISYRQKDNKGDGWVSEFVEALKTELESTFKEDISVYFDINPHDGLLETHDVDESLKEKLKCLIFIPIISRTYCDPKAFAWEHEFKAFVEQASGDEFGLKVRLPNGNVASRVLPIVIYDLDKQDIKLCESVLSGVLRGVEFIYKSSGVNRPLRANEDHHQDNLNKTYYRDQINKVANAIKEIINAIKHYNPQTGKVKQEVTAQVSITHKNKKTPILLSSFLALALIVLGTIFIPKLFNASTEFDKSIAVLPFVNLSNDPEQEYFSDGIVEAILNHLFKVGELKVISSTSTKRYKNTQLPLKQIAEELGVSAILEGSVQKIGNNVRITAQLIDARTDVHLWSEIYDKDLADIFSIQSEVAQAIARELSAVITPEEKMIIETIPTLDTLAYDYYLRGMAIFNKHTDFLKSAEYFEEAIQQDSTFALAYSYLAQCYQFLDRYSFESIENVNFKAKEAIKKALELNPLLGEAHATHALIMASMDWNIYLPGEVFKKAISLSPGSHEVYSSYAQYLRWLRKYDECISFAKKALELDPQNPMSYQWLAVFYFYSGQFDKSNQQLEKVLNLDPEFMHAYFLLAVNYASMGMLEDANKYADKALSYLSSGEPMFLSALTWVYVKTGEKDKARILFENMIELSNTRFVDPVYFAISYSALGENENAFSYLSKAFEIHSDQMIYLKAYSDWFFKDLSSDPRYDELLHKIGFEDK